MSHLHNDPEPSPALVSGDAWLHWQRLHPSGNPGARGAWWLDPSGALSYYGRQR